MDTIQNNPAYYARCQENIEACERIIGKPLSVADQEQIGAMVHRVMKAEREQRFKKQSQRRCA